MPTDRHAADPAAPTPLARRLRVADELYRRGRLDAAERLLAGILTAAPLLPAALHLAGLVAAGAGRLAEAARLVELAVRHAPPTPLYLSNLCTIYERLGRDGDARAAGERAVALDPDDAGAHHNLAVACYRCRDPAASAAAARRAIALAPALPRPHFALAEALLLQGAFAEGWEEYEWRLRLPGACAPLPPVGVAAWDGAPLPRGRLLLIADQGFGDAIQFCRYLPWAAARCGATVLACPPDLLPLLQPAFPGVPMVTRWQEATPFAAWQVLSGLPRLHGTRPETVPSAPAYLTADPARAAAWTRRLAARLPPGLLRVGIAWAGRASHTNDANRSADLDALGRLGDLPGIALVSLQTGPAAAGTVRYFGAAPLLDLGRDLADFADSAALIAGLDAVVAVDTAIAHLAGALGRPTCVLLPFAPDWRWLLGRADSPWYPSVRLFRQRAPRDWSGPLADAATALRLTGDERRGRSG